MKKLLAALLCLWAFAAAARGSTEVLFSPWDDAEGAIIRTVGEARTTIHVQAYLLTSRSIARSLVEAHRRGIQVSVLADQEQALRGNNDDQLEQLVAAGIPVAMETRYAAAHNKVILIDAEGAAPVVITGSYNFTWSAQARNSENLLILRGQPDLARRYWSNWTRHRADAQPWQKTPGVTLGKD